MFHFDSSANWTCGFLFYLSIQDKFAGSYKNNLGVKRFVSIEQYVKQGDVLSTIPFCDALSIIVFKCEFGQRSFLSGVISYKIYHVQIIST